MTISEVDRRLWIGLAGLSNLRAMTKFEAEEAEKERRKRMENKKDITVDEAKRLQKKRIEEKEAYKQGANDVWELAKRVFIVQEHGGFSGDELIDIFDKMDPYDVLTTFNAVDALERYREYEEKKKNEINVGDEVCQSENSMRVVVTKVYRNIGKFDALEYDGTAHRELTLSLWKKTGQRCEIEFKKTCEKEN